MQWDTLAFLPHPTDITDIDQDYSGDYLVGVWPCTAWLFSIKLQMDPTFSDSSLQIWVLYIKLLSPVITSTQYAQIKYHLQARTVLMKKQSRVIWVLMAWWWVNILQIFIFGWTIPVHQIFFLLIAQPLIENGAVIHILDSYEQNMRISPHFMLPVFGIGLFYLQQAFCFLVVWWLSEWGCLIFDSNYMANISRAFSLMSRAEDWRDGPWSCIDGTVNKFAISLEAVTVMYCLF